MKKNLIILIGLSLFIFFAISMSSTPDIPIEDLIEKYGNDESEFIEVDGLNIHYRDEGAGMPILLIHGTAASLHTWDDWAQSLKKDYRVIRLDIPGFGLTGPHPEHDYSIPAYSQLIEIFVEKIGLDSLYVAGNSLGGNIAWYFTAQNPDLVKRLILVDASGYPVESIPLIFKMGRTPVLNKLLTMITPRSFIAKNLREVYHDDNKISDELIDRYYKMALREGNREALVKRMQNDLVDFTDLIATINVPTLIVWGRHDKWVPVSNAFRFQEDIPNSELVILEESGHVPMEENPAETLAEVKRFLNDD
ncbi:MAG: alpha/beta hydrolase [Cyclobacteriaceae bacterium]